MESLTAAIEICKRKDVLREYLESREKEVVNIMTMLFDQGYATEVARKEDMAEARAEGKAEGREEGAYNKAVSTAKNLLEMGLLSLEQIAQATKLPLSEVAAL